MTFKPFGTAEVNLEPILKFCVFALSIAFIVTVLETR